MPLKKPLFGSKSVAPAVQAKPAKPTYSKLWFWVEHISDAGTRHLIGRLSVASGPLPPASVILPKVKAYWPHLSGTMEIEEVSRHYPGTCGSPEYISDIEVLDGRTISARQ